MFLVATIDRNWAIGKNGLPLYNIPVDQANFCEIVRGHTVLYGHNSYEFPLYKRPVDGCTNLVLSRKTDLSYPDGAIVIHNLTELDKFHSYDVYIAGGESIYRQLYERCKYAFLTQVDNVTLDSDAFFPRLDQMPNWQKIIEAPILEHQGLRYHFAVYVNNALLD